VSRKRQGKDAEGKRSNHRDQRRESNHPEDRRMGGCDRALSVLSVLSVLRPPENSPGHGQRDHVKGKPDHQRDISRSDHSRNGSGQVASRISDEQRNATDNAGLDSLKVSDAFEDASCVRTVQLREGVCLDLIRDRSREPPGREQQTERQIWPAWTVHLSPHELGPLSRLHSAHR
jgi:hypothetical protein